MVIGEDVETGHQLSELTLLDYLQGPVCLFVLAMKQAQIAQLEGVSLISGKNWISDGGVGGYSAYKA